MTDEPKLVQVVIKHAFHYHHADDTLEPFAPGVYEMTEAMANDPYVLYHSDNPPYVPPKVGTPEYVAEDHRRRQRRALLEAQSEELEDIERQGVENLPEQRRELPRRIPRRTAA